METTTKIHLAALRKHDKSNDIPRKIFFNENKFFQNLCVVIYMVLICISLMSSNAETPFIYLGDICMLFLDTCLFKHFFFFFALELQTFLLYYGYQTIIKYMICICVLLFFRLPFHSVSSFFHFLFHKLYKSFFGLMSSHLPIFTFLACVFYVISRKSLLRLMSRNFLCDLSSRSFTACI